MNQRIPSKLIQALGEKTPLLIAVSGGQDSVTLLAAAHAAGIPVAAATIVSEFSVPGEAERVETFCRTHEIPWYPVYLSLLTISELRKNPENRCYLCKKFLMETLCALAKTKKYAAVCDGTHADDPVDGRPGMRALRELGIRSPFAESGIGKEGIYALGKELGIPKIPSSSCLATRIPFGEEITGEKLEKISRAEQYLRDNGISGVLRVRIVGDEAVIETETAEVATARKLAGNMETIGFTRVRVAEYVIGGVQRWKQTQQ